VQTVTAHEWMIDSIARGGKLTYRFNPDQFDREKAEIYGYSFHSDGGVNRIETHIGGSTQSPVGKHLFEKKLLTLEITGLEAQIYSYRRTPRQLILRNDECTVWMSHYTNRYMFGWSHNLFIPDSLQEK
jgi:hypothetical protein